MTDENKHYIRQLNAGALPWEIQPDSREEKEHPLFGKEKEVKSVAYEGARVQPLPKNFTPSSEILEFLQIHQGISIEFITTQLVDFKLYWHETGEARKAWQNKFKSHVIYQWKRNQSETGQRTPQSTIEKLTDRSWDDDFQIEEEK